MKQSDADRSVRLLWEPPAEPTRGPKAALSLGRVVEAAMKVADAEGLDALTMRRVAETLGFTTMSLYRHVPGKDELLDLMLDAAFGETELTPKVPWREGLEFFARQLWQICRTHPWVPALASGRRVPGPEQMTRHDAALAVVRDLGLRPQEMVALVTTIVQFVDGVGRSMADRVLAERETGVSWETWWENQGSLWTHFTPERLPMMTYIYSAGGYDDPLDEFEFGLARVLDGLQAFIDAEDRPHSPPAACP